MCSLALRCCRPRSWLFSLGLAVLVLLLPGCASRVAEPVAQAPVSPAVWRTVMWNSPEADGVPLIGESRRMSNEIHYRATATTLEWGSSLVYFAMQQNGGLKSAYPHLWGNIPARPSSAMSTPRRR